MHLGDVLLNPQSQIHLSLKKYAWKICLKGLGFFLNPQMSDWVPVGYRKISLRKRTLERHLWPHQQKITGSYFLRMPGSEICIPEGSFTHLSGICSVYYNIWESSADFWLHWKISYDTWRIPKGYLPVTYRTSSNALPQFHSCPRITSDAPQIVFKTSANNPLNFDHMRTQQRPGD